MIGDSHVSRVGASLLNQVGLNEFINSTWEEYIESAIGLAKDTSTLVAFRSGIRARMKASSLFDYRRLSMAIEDFCSITRVKSTLTNT